ncbi:MAG: hypothetical protein E7238_00190 [Sarcina sp.]|nr:hypothetical protein [Sarcina sp.]
MSGHAAGSIAKTKKELQSFAQQTIYSASDMATTYAQLDAVGIKSAKSLVKGFGGLAAAAENPKQAMKTLSQQGVQMAAKPKVAWQDFKLMLEQTPAGIAAVAKEMGMTTSEMVQAVQDGEVSTDKFFKAVQKVGTSKAFTELATSYKTTGQALDGLSETVTNTLLPSFELFQGRAIKAVEKVIEKVESFDGQKIADTIGSIFNAFDSGGITGAIGEVTGLLDKLPDGFKKAAAAGGALMAVNTVNTVLDSGLWKAGVAGIREFQGAVRGLPGVLSKGLSKGAAEAGNTLLNITSRTFPQVLTGLSNVGDKAGGIFSKIGQAGSKAWENFTSDSVLGKAVGKVTGFAGKIGGAIGQVGGVILNTGGKLAGGLQTMMGIALKALMPAAMIGAALAGLGLLQEKFGEQINGILSMVQEKGPQIISNLANGISSRVPELIAQGATLVSNLLNTIGALAPSLVSAGVQIITSLVGGVAQSAPQLISGAVTAVGGFASGIISALPMLIVSGMQLLLGVAQGIAQNLPRMAQGAMQAVQNFAQGFIANLPTILATAGQIVMTLVQGITSALPALAAGAVSIIGTLARGFVSNLPQIVQTGVQVVASIGLGILSGIGTLLGMIPQLFGSVVDMIMTTDWIGTGQKIITAIGDGIMGSIGGIGGKIGDFFGGIADWVTGGEKGGEEFGNAASTTIEAKAPEVTAATQNLAANLQTSGSAMFAASGTQGGTDYWTSLQTGILGGQEAVNTAGNTLITGFNTDMLANMQTAGTELTTASSQLGLLLPQGMQAGLLEGGSAALADVTTFMSSTSELLNDGSVQSDADSSGQELMSSWATGISGGASAADTAVQTAATSVVSTLTGSAAEMQSAGQELGTAVVTGLTSGMETIGSAASEAVNSAVSSMRGGLSAMQSAGQQAGARFATGIRTGLNQAATAAKTSVKTIQTALKSIVNPANTTGRTAGTRFAAGIRAGMMQAVSASRSGVSAVVSALRSSIGPAGAAGRSAGSQYASGIRAGMGAARSAGTAVASSAVNGLKSGESSARSAGSSAGSSFAHGVSSKSGSARSAGKSLASAAKSGMSGTSTESIGRNMGEGLVRGLNSKYSAVASAARRLADKAAEAMRAAAKVASPSRVTKEIGKFMGKGLEIGLIKTAGAVAKAGRTVSKKALAGMRDAALKQQKSYNKKASAAAKEQQRYLKAYKWNLEQSKKFESQASKATSASWKKTLQDKAKQYAGYANQHLAAANKYEAAAKKYRAAAREAGKNARNYSDRIAGKWKENDFLRQAYESTKGFGISASDYVKKYYEKMKGAAKAGSFKPVANRIADSFKKAMTAKSKTIGDSASSIIVGATNSMINAAKANKNKSKKAYDKAIAQQKKYEKAASWNSKMSQKFAKDAKKSTGTEKQALEAKAKQYAKYADQHTKTAKSFETTAKKHKASIDKFTALATSYSKAGSTIKTAFTNAFNSKVNDAITQTQNRIKALGETYQKQYDAIIQARTTFRNKLRDVSLGDRFEDEKTGKTKTVLTDYNVMRRQVEQYSKNLERLKKIMPKGMMDEILAMDTEDGLAYTRKLLSLTEKQRKSYAASYNAFQKATTTASAKYYQPQIDELGRTYRNAVTKEFKSLRLDLIAIGKNVMQGFADGMKSKKKTLDSTGASLADSLIKTLKQKLKIHSPSKIATMLGSYTGQGFVNGVEDEVAAARAAMARLVETPEPQMAMAAGAESLSLNEKYNYTSNRHIVIETPVLLDGREIARGTAEYTEAELERRRRNSERLKGRR